MAKFKVLRPIEHNQKLYVPEAADAPATTKSFGHGNDIPVDRAGWIDLGAEEAGRFTLGQIEEPKKAKALEPEVKVKKP